jgi:hypothetical protein
MHDDIADDTQHSTLARRGLIAGVAALAAAAVLDQADPASANDPNDVVLGAANSTPNTTTITNTTTSSATALRLKADVASYGIGLDASGTGYGVFARGVTYAGVSGHAPNYGVAGTAEATSGATAGVSGGAVSPQGAGVLGQSPGFGVVALGGQFSRTPDVQGPIGLIASSESPAGLGALLQGVRAPLRLVPSTTAGAPASGTHEVGEIVASGDSKLYFCTAAGTPGTWVELGVQPPPPPAAQPRLTLLPTPERFVDTRSGLGGVQGPLPGQSTRTFTMTGRNGEAANQALRIPDNATAIVGNVTVIGAADAPLGSFATIWPSGNRPTVSNINFGPSAVTGAIANSFVGALGQVAGHGTLQVYNHAACDYVLDVSGYYVLA